MLPDEGKLSENLEKLRRRLHKRAGQVLELFLRWDVDGNGVITRDEFKGMMPECVHAFDVGASNSPCEVLPSCHRPAPRLCRAHPT